MSTPAVPNQTLRRSYIRCSGPDILKLFSCSAQLSMNFSLLIQRKCQQWLAFSYSLVEKFSCSAMLNKNLQLLEILDLLAGKNHTQLS